MIESFTVLRLFPNQLEHLHQFALPLHLAHQVFKTAHHEMEKPTALHEGLNIPIIRRGKWAFFVIVPCALAWLFSAFAGFSQTTNYDFNLRITNDLVYTLALQSDGRILVGAFSEPLRLQTNGALDTTFDPRLRTFSYEGTCYTIGVQDDGKILVGGKFQSLGGESHTNLGRFNVDGTPDSTFNANATGLFPNEGNVFALAFDGSGRKLIGGDFLRLGGQTCSGLGRLNSNDVSDSSFTPTDNGVPFSLAVQSDNLILVGGYFTSLAGQSRTNLGRLNTDGTLDFSFNPRLPMPWGVLQGNQMEEFWPRLLSKGWLV